MILLTRLFHLIWNILNHLSLEIWYFSFFSLILTKCKLIDWLVLLCQHCLLLSLLSLTWHSLSWLSLNRLSILNDWLSILLLILSRISKGLEGFCSKCLLVLKLGLLLVSRLDIYRFSGIIIKAKYWLLLLLGWLILRFVCCENLICWIILLENSGLCTSRCVSIIGFSKRICGLLT